MDGGGGKFGGKVGMGIEKSSEVATKKEEGAKGGTAVKTPKVNSAGAVATGAAATTKTSSENVPSSASSKKEKDSDAIQAAVKAGNINIHREERE